MRRLSYFSVIVLLLFPIYGCSGGSAPTPDDMPVVQDLNIQPDTDESHSSDETE